MPAVPRPDTDRTGGTGKERERERVKTELRERKRERDGVMGRKAGWIFWVDATAKSSATCFTDACAHS